MAKEFIISTSKVNSYGTRVLTSGISTVQFEKNPVLLYMHRRDHTWANDSTMVIGRVENLRIEGDELIGKPVFDLEDEFAAKVARKWDNDFLRMCSAGLEPIEFSSSPEHVEQGQTRATITKSKLIEVSIVDIGANDDALKLYEPGGKVLTLAAGMDNDLLPLLKAEPVVDVDEKQEKTNHYMMKNILLKLGLGEGSTEQEVIAAIEKLQIDAARSGKLELSRVEEAVDAAIVAGKMTADKREKFISLGKAAGYDHLQTALEAMAPVRKPLDLINPGAAAGSPAAKQTYSEMNEEELVKLRSENPAEFARLFKQEFGFELGSKE